MNKPFQVVGIGNALVDVICPVEDGFLDAHGVIKGIMQLIDLPRAGELYAAMGPAPVISGGSVGNTIGGLSGLGGAHRLRRQGARRPVRRRSSPTTCGRSAPAFDTPMAPADHPLGTGRSLILFTPGRRAVDEHLPRRRRDAGARRHRRAPDGGDRVAPARGLPLRPPGEPGGLRHARARAAKAGGGRAGDHPFRPVLRRAPPRGVPRADPRRTWTWWWRTSTS